MIFIAIFLIPVFHRQRLVSVYLYLGRRFDDKTQLLISGMFQLSRAAVAGITVYGVASMIAITTGLSFAQSVVLFGAITIIYDVLGGIRAVILSDVIQMIILTSVLGYLAYLLIGSAGGLESMLAQIPAERTAALSFRHHGLGDGHDFAFLPMLIGGFFLYVAYYGCDQSQVQRQLCAATQDDNQKILFINGVLRFPLVLLYCLIGAGLAAYASSHTDFLPSLPLINEAPNYNMALPVLFSRELPVGVVGLAVVALLAAAMSSLDSVINSLSATTLKDFVKPAMKERIATPAQELWWGRALTVFWGVFALVTAFFVDDIASTVIVAVNKVGSLINGPILGVFLLGLMTKTATGRGARVGFFAGLAVNAFLWAGMPSVSWLWWNVIGLAATMGVGLMMSGHVSSEQNLTDLVWSPAFYQNAGFTKSWVPAYGFLGLWTLLLMGVLAMFGTR
jgi:SSS family solute:Na+ symporter